MTVDLAYELAGPDSSPCVVLAGSLGATRAVWDAQLPVLTQFARVLRFDQRGHGESPVPAGPYEIAGLGRDLLALLDRLAIERASIWGVSLGGMVGMWLAANAPERVERLVVACSSAYAPPAEDWRERARAVREAGSPAVVADAVIGRWLTYGFREREPALTAQLRAMIAATPAEGYAACCEAVAAMDLRGELGRIRAPTLVLSGAQDPATPPEHGELIAHAIAGARFELIEPAAHAAAVEQPDVVNRLVRDHIDWEGSR